MVRFISLQERTINNGLWEGFRTNNSWQNMLSLTRIESLNNEMKNDDYRILTVYNAPNKSQDYGKDSEIGKMLFSRKDDITLNKIVIMESAIAGTLEEIEKLKSSLLYKS